jgi:excisionase family DNA binding protein
MTRREITTRTMTDTWITTQAAQELTGYSRAYLRRLAGQQRVPAQKVGRDWLLHRDSLLAHKVRMQALGDQRHNPWRAELTAEERGRTGDPDD